MDIDATFPALTVRQPWADTIVDGVKDCENRTWTVGYRGKLWIHAAKILDTSELAQRMCGDRVGGVRGHIIGSVELRDIVARHDSPWAFNDSWHWLLAGAVRLDRPVPAKGWPRLWYPRLE